MKRARMIFSVLPYDFYLYFICVLLVVHISCFVNISKTIQITGVLAWLLWYFSWNHKKNGKNNVSGTFLCVLNSFIWKKELWVYQINFLKTGKRKKSDECPADLFDKDLRNLNANLPPEKRIHCITHEIIRKKIEKNFEIITIKEGMSANLKNIKRRMKGEKCKNCRSEKKCPLIKEGADTKFYKITFKKKLER